MARTKRNAKGASIFSSIKKTFNNTIAKAKVKVNQIKHGAKSIKAKVADRVKPRQGEYPRTLKAKLDHVNDLKKLSNEAPKDTKKVFRQAYQKEGYNLDDKIKRHFSNRAQQEQASFKKGHMDGLKERLRTLKHFKELGLSDPARKMYQNNLPGLQSEISPGLAHKKAFSAIIKNQPDNLPPSRFARQDNAIQMDALPTQTTAVTKSLGDINSRKKAGYKRGRGFWDMMGKLAEHQHDPVP